MSLSRRDVRRLHAAGFEIAGHDGVGKRAGRFLLWLLIYLHGAPGANRIIADALSVVVDDGAGRSE